MSAKEEKAKKEATFEKLAAYFVGKQLTLEVRDGPQIAPQAVWEHCEGYLIKATVIPSRRPEAKNTMFTFTIDDKTDLREVFENPDEVVVGGENGSVEWTLHKVTGV